MTEDRLAAPTADSDGRSPKSTRSGLIDGSVLRSVIVALSIGFFAAACGVGDSLPSADPQALSAAGAAEAARIASQSPAARFARAAEAQMPPALADATTRIEPGVLAALDGLVLVPWEQSPNPFAASMRIEEMAYSDSSGLVMISFQDWPSNVDPAVLFPADRQVINREGYQIAIRDERPFPAVTIFDGKVAVHVQAWDEPKLTTSEAEALAVAYYLALAG